MVQSKYLKKQKNWPDRCQSMREDIFAKEYDYLYFKIVLNLNDAKDNADYEREMLLRELLEARRRMSVSSMIALVEKLDLVKS